MSPDLSTLPKRMCYAAEVLEEVCKRYRYDTNVPWQASALRREAIEVAGEDQLVDMLAREMHAADDRDSVQGFDNVSHVYRRVAKTLVDSGWCKDVSSG